MNIGLNKFLNRTYITAGLGFLGALATAYATMGASFIYTNPGMTMLGGLVMTLGGLLGSSYMPPKHVVEQVNGNPILKTENSFARLALYGIGVAGLGLSAAPMLAAASMLSPSIIPNCMALTAGIFGGASLIAYNTPSTKMLSLGRTLMGGLIGLLAIQLVGILSFWIVGPNPLSLLLFRADTYLGILLFTGFIAYDTHVAIQSYKSGNADHLSMSIQLLLDIWNIFIRLIEIFK